MKKITFMMSLLLAMGSMTTSAQVLDRTGWKITTSGECDDSGSGHANAIIDGKNNTYWHSNWANNGQANSSGDASKKLPQFFQVDLGSEQTFRSIMYVPRVNLDNGTVYSFKVYVSNTAFPSTAEGTSAANIVAGLKEADLKMEGTFDYTGKGSQPTMLWSADQDITGRYVLFVITDAKGNNSGKWASCAEFNLSKDNFKVTYNYTNKGTALGQKVVYTQTPKENVPTPGTYLINSTITETSNGIYTVECTTPFESAETYNPETAHWYAIDIHNNQANKLWYVANDGGFVTTPTIDKGYVTNLTDNYLWTFVGNVTNGYKIYNKATGKAIAYTTNATTSDNGDVFKIKSSTASNKTKGFCFTKDGSNYLNEQGNKIATWTDSDEGSTMHVQEPNDYILSYAADYENQTYDDSNAPENAIGADPYLSNAENLAAYKAAYAAAIAESATETEINNLITLNKEVEAGKAVSTIEEGKYYRLYNHANKKIMRVDPTNNTIMDYSEDANEAKSIGSVVTFKSIPDEPGRYRMMIEGKTFGKATTSNNVVLQEDNSDAKGSFIVSHVGTKFKFRNITSSTPRYSYIHCNDGKVVGWEANNGGASWWYVVPATDVEIAMAEVNGKRYASAYLPFSVNTVNGAQAYVGELNDAKNVLDMTAVNGVPANNGFVLVGNAEKATLTIGNAEPLTITNALTGSNVKVALETTTGSGESATVTDHRAEYLVFGTNAGNVGFYKPSATNNTIAANKAFIAASSLTTGEGAIAMNFGGNITGINNAVVASENAPIFDLSGRRVVKAVKGGVYIQNGKKFVK
uniref:discoidin domain-containing protein n=1 Tax=Alloprevotella sp. TaxID=1872471 RepID=UPI00402A5633